MSMIHTAGNNSATFLTHVQDGDNQPNATDLRLARVFKLNEDQFILTNETKIHLKQEEIFSERMEVTTGVYEEMFTLSPGYYCIEYENKISVGKSEAGFVISRSTLVRNGVFLTTGLYDSGYEGKMVSGMHVTTGTLMVAKGTRMGQYLCFSAETMHLYDGDYQEKKTV